jgi:hypothetical protein
MARFSSLLVVLVAVLFGSGLFAQDSLYVVVEDTTMTINEAAYLCSNNNKGYTVNEEIDFINGYTTEPFLDNSIDICGNVVDNDGAVYFYGFHETSDYPYYWDPIELEWTNIANITTASITGLFSPDGTLYFVGTYITNQTYLWEDTNDGTLTENVYWGVERLAHGDLTNEVYLINGAQVGVVDVNSDDWYSDVNWTSIPQSPIGGISGMDFYVDDNHLNGILGFVHGAYVYSYEIGVSTNWELLHQFPTGAQYTAFTWLRGSEAHFGEYAVGRTYPEQCITFFRAVFTGTIEGQVTLNGGTGNITEVTITANDVSTTPNDDGFYSLEVESGVYDVVATLDGYTDSGISDIEVVLNETTYGVDLFLDFIPTHGIIEGTISLNDRPYGFVEDVLITADTLFTNPDADGNYSLELPEGTYDITASLPGYESALAENIEVIAGETLSDIDMTLDYILVFPLPNEYLGDMEVDCEFEDMTLFTTLPLTENCESIIVSAQAVSPNTEISVEYNAEFTELTITASCEEGFPIGILHFEDTEGNLLGSTGELTLKVFGDFMFPDGMNITDPNPHPDGYVLELEQFSSGNLQITIENRTNLQDTFVVYDSLYSVEGFSFIEIQSDSTWFDSRDYELNVFHADINLVDLRYWYSVTFVINHEVYVGIDNDVISAETQLLGNYPNPFNPTTEIRFQLSDISSDAEIQIYNTKGQLVEELGVRNLELGINEVIWNASEFGSGIYFYKLNSADSPIKKMVLLK